MVDKRRRDPRSGGGDDKGHVAVVEAILITALLVGGVGFVLSYQLPTDDGKAARVNLELVSEDVFTILEAFPACNDLTGAARATCLQHYGGSLLTRYVTEALHGKTDGLRDRINTLLPEGAEHKLYLDTGKGLVTLHEEGVPARERVTVGRPYTPEWSVAFATPDFSCYDPLLGKMRASVLPVHLSRIPEVAPSTVNLTFQNGHETELEPSAAAGFYNATILPDDGTGRGFPQSPLDLALANVTMNGRFLPGGFTYLADGSACGDLTATWSELKATLNVTTVKIDRLDPRTGAWVETTRAEPGDTVRYRVDFTAWATDLGATLNEVRVATYAPVPPLSGETAYLSVHEDTLPAGVGSGALEWTLPEDTLYGAHFVVATLNMTLPGVTASVEMETHVPTSLTVDLRGGTPVLNPVYRLLLEVWFPDWG